MEGKGIKIFLALLVVSTGLYFFDKTLHHTPVPTTEEPTTPVPEVEPFVWPDFETFSTNDTLTDATISQIVHGIAGYQLGQEYERMDSRYDPGNNGTIMYIEVPTSFDPVLLQAIEEVAAYYNELFEMTGVKERFEVKSVSQISNTAEVSFSFSSSLGEKVVAQATVLSTYNIEWGDKRLGTIAVNSNKVQEFDVGTEAYLGFKRTAFHEIGHTLGLAHFLNDPMSIMAPNVPPQTYSYWRMTPNDIRNYFSLMEGKRYTDEQLYAIEAYIEKESKAYYEYLKNDYKSEFQSSTVNENTVAYYYFDMSNKTSNVECIKINLNAPFKGYYTAETLLTNGRTQTFTGKFFIENTVQASDGKTAQVIFLESFIYAGDEMMQLTAITNSKDGPAITIGDTLLSRLKGISGKVYATEQERDNALLVDLMMSSALKASDVALTIPEQQSKKNFGDPIYL